MRAIFILVCVLVAQAFAVSRYAAYTLTQESPNYLNVFSVDASSGELTYVRQVSTGGNGGATGSQNALIVYQNYIFGLNPNSNTLSMFSISQSDPTQVSLIGSPADTGFDWPNSVTASNNIACVVTSGANNGVRCFTFNSKGLSAISGSDRALNLSLTTPPAFHTGPAMISFTPDGKDLAVSVKNTQPALAGPSVFLFTITSSGMPSTTPATAGPKGNVPFGFTFDSSYMVLTDAAPFGGDGGIIPLSISSGSVSYADNFTLVSGQAAACWIIYNKNNQHFYTSNAGSSSVSEMSRSGTSFNMVNSYSLGNATLIGAVTDSAILNVNGVDYFYQVAGKHLYVLKLGSNTATVIQNLDGTAQSTSISNSGMAVYASPSSSTSTTSAASGPVNILVTLVAVMIASLLFVL